MLHRYQYVVVRYVPNVVRDEAINVGIILRDVAGGAFTFKFLSRTATVRKLLPEADQRLNLVRYFQQQLGTPTRDPLFPADSLGWLGHPTAPEFFDHARHEFTGNLRLSETRGIMAESLQVALDRVFATRVAEPGMSPRPINYQTLAPSRLRDRLWGAFKRGHLLDPDLVRRQFPLQGSHAPWTFDLGCQNGDLHVINSVALDAPSLEANVGRALVFKGMMEEVGERRQLPPIHGTAVIQQPRDEKTPGRVEAKAILKDAQVQVVEIAKLNELVGYVRKDLLAGATR